MIGHCFFVFAGVQFEQIGESGATVAHSKRWDIRHGGELIYGFKKKLTESGKRNILSQQSIKIYLQPLANERTTPVL